MTRRGPLSCSAAIVSHRLCVPKTVLNEIGRTTGPHSLRKFGFLAEADEPASGPSVPGKSFEAGRRRSLADVGVQPQKGWIRLTSPFVHHRCGHAAAHCLTDERGPEGVPVYLQPERGQEAFEALQRSTWRDLPPRLRMLPRRSRQELPTAALWQWSQELFEPIRHGHDTLITGHWSPVVLLFDRGDPSPQADVLPGEVLRFPITARCLAQEREALPISVRRIGHDFCRPPRVTSSANS